MKKGFFLSLISLVLLIYSISTLQSRLNANIESERTYAQLMKLSTYEIFFSNFNKNLIQTSLFYISRNALYVMAKSNHVFTNKEEIKDCFLSLIKEGKWENIDSHYQTINDLMRQIENTLKNQGFELNNAMIDVTDLSEDSTGIVVKVTYSMDIRDTKGKNSFRLKEQEVQIRIPLDGMPDPLFYRNFKNTEQKDKWIMLYYPGEELFGSNKLGFPETPIARIVGKDKVKAIQGWGYGRLVDALDCEKIPDKDREYYFLYGTFDEITGISKQQSQQVPHCNDYKQFGGYIILGDIEHQVNPQCGSEEVWGTFNPTTYRLENHNCMFKTGTPKTDKPFIVIDMEKENFKMLINSYSQYTKTPFYHLTQNDQVVPTYAIAILSNVNPNKVKTNPTLKNLPNPNTKARLEGVEILKDALAGGYYFIGNGPTFFGRLMNCTNEELCSEEGFFGNKGIYTILVEKDFNKFNNKDTSKCDSIDYKYYNQLHSNCYGLERILSVANCIKYNDCGNKYFKPLMLDNDDPIYDILKDLSNEQYDVDENGNY